MNRELPRQRHLWYDAQHLLVRHPLDVRGAVEAASLLLLLGFAVWVLFPRSWEDVAARSAIQFGLLTILTFISAAVLVRAALALSVTATPLARLAGWLSPSRMLIAFVASAALGETLALLPWSGPRLALPLIYALNTVLPALTIVSYLSNRLGMRLDGGRSFGLFSYGTLVAIAVAQIGESSANGLLGLVADRALAAWVGSDGHVSLELLRQSQAVRSGDGVFWLAAVAGVLLMLLQAMILAPVIEEGAKASGLLIPRLRVDRNGAFMGGMYAGMGFALAESLMRGSIVAGDGTLLLLRGGAGLVHALATGLGALAVYDLLHGRRRPAVDHALRALGVHAVWNLAASIPSLLSVAILVVSPSASGDATDVAANLPGFQFIWLGIMVLLALYLVVWAVRIGEALRRDGALISTGLPVALPLQAVERLDQPRRRGVVLLTAILLALVAAGAFNFSSSVDAYHQSLVSERYANARESLASGDYEQAIHNLEMARRWSPDTTQVDQAIQITRRRLSLLMQMYWAGKDLYDDGRWDQAVWYFDRILELEPRFKDTWQLRERAMERAQRG